MSVCKITDNVYSVGVFNPNLRIFDIVMPTKYGTSYNAYVVKAEKTALIETCHLDFIDQYLENVKSVVDLSKVEYLILNHNEPDHSGAVKRLSEIIPNLKIIVSQAGSIYLKNITNNSDLNVQVVKDNDTLDLGDKTLKFVSAPFLHWPDSMFSYLEDEKVLFTCDFLGAHYCELTMLDHKIPSVYENAYFESMQNYYNAIFGPFKPYVLSGLEKMEGLDVEYVATSHGPVLTKGGKLERVKELYKEWSTPVTKDKKEISLFYCSAYHNTEHIANSIADGIKRELGDSAEIGVYDINNYDMGFLSEKLNSSSAVLIGSPTINRDAVKPVWDLLATIDAINFAKKPVALFGSYGWSGEAIPNLKARLQGVKANIFTEDFKVTFVPSDEELKKAVEYGAEFAKTLK